MRKRKVLFHSNYAAAKTGFGGFMKEILTYLYKTGKYDLTLYASCAPWSMKDFERFPWKTYGALPNDPRELQHIKGDPSLEREANYGGYLIDKVIQTVKPDVYIGVEDPWGIDFCRKKRWWNKIPCVVHTTIDSRPIADMVVNLAKSTPYFYSWADFATKELHKLEQKHVKTMRGSVNTNVFRRLSEAKRRELRMRAGISKDTFCVGMLSRNQLRKSFPNIIKGFAEFKIKNPDIKNVRLLFFTHFSEGWNIPKFLNDPTCNTNFAVKPDEVLATYKCKGSGRYYVLPFMGQGLDNPETGQKGSLITVNVQEGLTEEQVNEWYNLLDVYCHAFTSGGQERGIQEAKLAELVTLVTNYSCGEDSCVPEAASLDLAWEEYREPNESQFVKATTKTYSIVKQLEKVYHMPEEKRRAMGQQARQWVLDNFSIEVIGKQYEELLDSLPFPEYDFDVKEPLKDPDAVIPEIQDNMEWIHALYKLILKRDSEDEEGTKYWLAQLEKGSSRGQIETFFRKVAREENGFDTVEELRKILGPERPDQRVLITMPESLGDCLHLTALLSDARRLYPNKIIYIATKPKFKEVFEPLVGKYIDRVIDWYDIFDNVYAMEGYANQEKFFQIILSAHYPTQRAVNYIHNGEDKSEIQLNYAST